MGLRKKQDNDGWTLTSESNKVEKDLFFKNSIDPFTEKKEPKRKKAPKPRYLYRYEDRIGKLIKQQALCGVGMAACGVAVISLGITYNKLGVVPSGVGFTTIGVLMTAYELYRLKEHKREIIMQESVRQRLR